MRQSAAVLVIAFMAASGPADAQTGFWRSSPSAAKPAPAPDLNRIKVLDLETAQRTALAENPGLAAAAARVDQARERLLQAQGRWWPRIDAGGSYKREWLSDRKSQDDEEVARIIQDFFPDTSVTFEDPKETWKAEIGASWVLFDGFRRKFSIAAARYGEQESQMANEDSRRLLLSSVAASFYRAQLARENAAIAEADEAFNRNQLQAAQARYRAGTGSLSDSLNFEVQVNSARANLIRTRRQYEAALIGLASLMGLPEGKIPAHMDLRRLENETAGELQVPDADAQLDYARKNRPDLIQSLKNIEQQNALIGVARSGFFPIIELKGAVEGERENHFLDEDDFGQSVSAVVTFNLFDGGTTLARYNEARFKLEEAKKAHKDLENTVTSDVLKALSELKASQEQLLLQRQNAALVQENRDLVEKEYRAGKESLVRLNEAQRDLNNAQVRLALALASLGSSWQGLRAATGEILLPFAD
jgi:outer membrane protein TolC